MNKIKSFSVFKRKEVEEGKPTHSISTKIGEEYVDIGACWTKDSKNGKYLSGALQNTWVKNDGSVGRKSFVIVEEQELDNLIEELALYKQGALQPLTSAGTKVPDFSEVDEKNSEPPF